MAPTTRSKTLHLAAEAAADEGSDCIGDSESDLDSLHHPIVRSPYTGLLYDISRLPSQDPAQNPAIASSAAGGRLVKEDRDVQGRVRELFSGFGWHEAPPINLHFTAVDGDHQFYAFQLRESTPFSIRIGTPDSKWPGPQCICQGGKPCHHLMWLYDAIAKLTLYEHDPREPLRVEADGSISKLGDLFKRVADFRLDMLTDGLHSAVGSSEAYQIPPWSRVEEVKLILSAFDGLDDGDDQHSDDQDDAEAYHSRRWPPPPAPQPKTRRGRDSRKKTTTKRNLWETVRDLLERNNEVFSIFLNMLSPRERARNPYFRLRTRADRILRELDLYAESLPDCDAARRQRMAAGADLEGRCDVAWAARHLLGATAQIRGELLGQHNHPAETWEREDAAQVLVYMLRRVVFAYDVDKHPGRASQDRNLYAALVAGPEDSGFVVEVLALVTDQTQYIEELEDVQQEVRNKRRVNELWLAKLGLVIRRMRDSVRRDYSRPGSSAGTSAGTKRSWEDD